MLTRTFAWGVIGVVAIGVAWWLLDPVGFAQNPLFTWLNLRAQGYHR